MKYWTPFNKPGLAGKELRPKRWSLLLAMLLAAVLLYLSVSGVEWGRVWRTIASAEWPYVAAAAGFTMLTFFLRALRWRILLNAETRFTVGTGFWANSAGYLGTSV